MYNKSRAYVMQSIDASLEKCGLDYVDLYLVHDPNGGNELRAAVWDGMADVKDSGKARSIGVSNFGVKHLENLLARKPKYVPSVNQVDLVSRSFDRGTSRRRAHAGRSPRAEGVGRVGVRSRLTFNSVSRSAPVHDARQARVVLRVAGDRSRGVGAPCSRRALQAP